MTAIAWAIFCAAYILMPARKKDAHYEINNLWDVVMFFTGFGFLIYYSGKM